VEKLRFAVSLPSQNEYRRMQAAYAVEAGNQLGIEVSVLCADSDAIQQSQQVLDLIQRSKNKPNGIVLEPLTAVGSNVLPKPRMTQGSAGWFSTQTWMAERPAKSARRGSSRPLMRFCSDSPRPTTLAWTGQEQR
jgi:hypothetical protein